MTVRELSLLSVLIILIPVAIFSYSDGAGIGDLGSLMGAFSGILAVIWFYRGLRLQSIQIEEQRTQFSTSYYLQHQDSLLNFLDKASERIEKRHKELIEALGIPDSSHVFSAYLKGMNYYKEALKSTDPHVVLEQTRLWMEIENPCIIFMSSVKDVIILHHKRLGLEEKNEDEDLVDYVYINSSYLFKQPFMAAYENTVRILSEQMMLLSNGRKAMILARKAAMALVAPEGIMKKDKIIEDIEKHNEASLPLPKICEKLVSEQSASPDRYSASAS